MMEWRPDGDAAKKPDDQEDEGDGELEDPIRRD